ncbi:MAG: methionine adenosyltransferase [Myxococcota bacterium]|nr:methionine adenosyltransferase [Myxococcota bacterium]
MKEYTLFTSESVSEGHPDKVADQISDDVVDYILSLDPEGKAAIETLIGPGFCIIAGEAFARTDHLLERLRDEVPARAKSVLREIGYSDEVSGFDIDQAEYKVRIGAQSQEIRNKVEQGEGAVGAGDQGLMFGYACNEQDNGMPLAIDLSHRLVQRQADVRKAGLLDYLRPDAKSQVTVAYEGKVIAGVNTVVVSTQHAPVDLERLRREVKEHIIDPVVPETLRCPDFRIIVNPGGSFTLGGPAADCGLTGRKIIVDTYGGSCPHGGGAFSGKDPSKVDRTAAYAARFVAQHIVAGGFAERCTVQLAYAIGALAPVSVYLDCDGTETTPIAELQRAVERIFDLSPRGIIETLGLRRVQYRQTAAHGHFGRDFPWDRTPLLHRLKNGLGR